jgi:hypothetical protein
VSAQTSLVLAVVDELADRNMLAPADIEELIARIAQRTQSVAEQLVWWSPQTRQALLDGQAMTRQQAIHLCLTHTRNEIDQAQTTCSRIVYRTPEGAVCTYEGAPPWPSPTSCPAGSPHQKRSRS